jgi:hypothetical protein
MNPLSVVPWWIKYPVIAIGLIAYRQGAAAAGWAFKLFCIGTTP